jgi:hypothetical protein
MTENEQQDPSAIPHRVSTLDRWRWPIVAMAVAVLALVGYLETCRRVADTAEAPERAVAEAARLAAGIAERFRGGRITETFTADIPRLNPGGTLLELASFEAHERLRRVDERSALFDLLYLGTNVTEIRAPVTYRYHLRLDDPWWLEVRGHTCLVRAPRIRPSLPPAIHTDRMEKHSERGWLRFDVDEQMQALEKSLTPRLNERAADGRQLELVRETCRRRVAEFVRNWLLREDHWRRDRFRSVVVVFADDPQPEAAGEPTLTIEDDSPPIAIPGPGAPLPDGID